MTALTDTERVGPAFEGLERDGLRSSRTCCRRRRWPGCGRDSSRSRGQSGRPASTTIRSGRTGPETNGCSGCSTRERVRRPGRAPGGVGPDGPPLDPMFLLSSLTANITGPGGHPMYLHYDQDYVPCRGRRSPSWRTSSGCSMTSPRRTGRRDSSRDHITRITPVGHPRP